MQREADRGAGIEGAIAVDIVEPRHDGAAADQPRAGSVRALSTSGSVRREDNESAKPGLLPIQQPTVRQVVINEKTAKAIGLLIPYDLTLAPTSCSTESALDARNHGSYLAAGLAAAVRFAVTLKWSLPAL